MTITVNVDNIQGSGTMTIYGAGTGAGITIDSSGYVSYPAAPAFKGYFGEMYSPTANYYPYLNTSWSINVIVNSAASRITVPVEGKYLVHCQQQISGEGVYLFIRKNGGFQNVCAHLPGAVIDWDIGTSAIFDLAANDYVDFYYQNTVDYAFSTTFSSVALVKVA